MVFVSEKSPEKRFNLESYVYSIMRISEVDLIDAQAKWLSGFDLMYGGRDLDFNKLTSYITIVLGNSGPFTPLVSKEFASAHRDDINSHKLAPVYLPINRGAHIAFWIKNRDDTSVQLLYEDFRVHGCVCSLPNISLKYSVDLSKDFSAMRRLKEGTFDVADDIIIRPENFVDVMDSYTAFDSLIRAARR